MPRKKTNCPRCGGLKVFKSILCQPCRRLKNIEDSNKRFKRGLKTHKECSVCSQIKLIDDFYNSKASIDGKSYRCKECDNIAGERYRELNPQDNSRNRRNAQLKLKFGIGIAEYEVMLEKQGGTCAICGGVETKNLGNGNPNSFSVDHCHETNKIRGLLCNNCNRGLGLLGDTVESVQKALDYLKEMH